MTLKITHKHGTAASTPPAASDIDVGEIAINSADADLFTKDTAGAVQVFKSKFTQVGTGAVPRTIASKLSDVVSVKDFGAIGNGIANDTAAIQAAIDAVAAQNGGTVFIPAGTYKLSSSIGSTTLIKNGTTGGNTGDTQAYCLKIPSANIRLEGVGETSILKGSWSYEASDTVLAAADLLAEPFAVMINPNSANMDGTVISKLGFENLNFENFSFAIGNLNTNVIQSEFTSLFFANVGIGIYHRHQERNAYNGLHSASAMTLVASGGMCAVGSSGIDPTTIIDEGGLTDKCTFTNLNIACLTGVKDGGSYRQFDEWFDTYCARYALVPQSQIDTNGVNARYPFQGLCGRALYVMSRYSRPNNSNHIGQISGAKLLRACVQIEAGNSWNNDGIVYAETIGYTNDPSRDQGPVGGKINARGTDISFTSNNTITTAGSVTFTDFYEPADTIIVSGSILNDGTYTVSTVNATTITTTQTTINTEAAGNDISIVRTNEKTADYRDPYLTRVRTGKVSPVFFEAYSRTPYAVKGVGSVLDLQRSHLADVTDEYNSPILPRLTQDNVSTKQTYVERENLFIDGTLEVTGNATLRGTSIAMASGGRFQYITSAASQTTTTAISVKGGNNGLCALVLCSRGRNTSDSDNVVYMVSFTPTNLAAPTFTKISETGVADWVTFGERVTNARGTDISFTANNTITTAGSVNFSTLYTVGDRITVSGSTSNDATYTVNAVNATTITTAETTIQTEAAGDSVYIVRPVDGDPFITVNGGANNCRFTFIF